MLSKISNINSLDDFWTPYITYITLLHHKDVWSLAT